MKKILTVLLAIVCLCCSFFTGCNLGDKSSEIENNIKIDKLKTNVKFEKVKITGEKVKLADIESWIANRQETYLDSDTKKNNGPHWYYVEIIEKSDDDEKSICETDSILIIKGKVGIEIDDNNKVHKYYDIKLNLQYDVNHRNEWGGKVERKEIIMIEQIYKCIDNYVYSDLKKINKTVGAETYERTRYKRLNLNLYDNININNLLCLEGENVKLYGINPSYIFTKYAEVYCKYYVDGNSLFLDNDYIKNNYDYVEYKRQYECVFSSSSAKLEKLRMHEIIINYSEDKSYVQQKFENQIIAERIDGAEIKEPSDIDEYLEWS